MDEKLTLTQEWDKTFPVSSKVNHSEVTFRNHYGITFEEKARKKGGSVVK